MSGKPIPVERRFWQKVLCDIDSRCWLWQSNLNNHGYPTLSVNRRPKYAHRFAYELLRGEIPDSLHIDHLCRRPACVNPDHLEPVTHRENVRRGLWGALKLTCPNGHLWIAENQYTRPDTGARMCAICRDIRNKARGRKAVSR